MENLQTVQEVVIQETMTTSDVDDMLNILVTHSDVDKDSELNSGDFKTVYHLVNETTSNDIDVFEIGSRMGIITLSLSRRSNFNGKLLIYGNVMLLNVLEFASEFLYIFRKMTKFFRHKKSSLKYHETTKYSNRVNTTDSQCFVKFYQQQATIHCDYIEHVISSTKQFMTFLKHIDIHLPETLMPISDFELWHEVIANAVCLKTESDMEKELDTQLLENGTTCAPILKECTQTLDNPMDIRKMKSLITLHPQLFKLGHFIKNLLNQNWKDKCF